MRYQIFRELIDRDLVTPSERLLFRRILELELENAQLKDAMQALGRPVKIVCNERKKEKTNDAAL